MDALFRRSVNNRAREVSRLISERRGAIDAADAELPSPTGAGGTSYLFSVARIFNLQVLREIVAGGDDFVAVAILAAAEGARPATRRNDGVF